VTCAPGRRLANFPGRHANLPQPGQTESCRNMENKILVSIVIPCRQEEKFIGKCLDSIIDNCYPQDELEVLVVDGMSDDGTREIVHEYSNKYTWIKLIDNPEKIIPAALNIGIRNALGDIIIRMDAHNIYGKDYIAKCVKYLNEYNVDNVGGVWHTLPGNNTAVAEAIALGLSNQFGVGNAYYRIGLKESRLVDTVPFGCYRRKMFDVIGLYDETMIRNEDDELNTRLIKNGGKILLVPEIVSYYYARDTLKKLWEMCFQYGYFKPLVIRKVGSVFTWRQIMPALFMAGMLIFLLLSFISGPFRWSFMTIVALYLALNLFYSLKISLAKGLKYFPILPLVFFALHTGYGTGYLKGIWDFLVREEARAPDREIALTR
jgi:cellulose synthase/poly-beta-1,6-N-acetylglucosamine synthase-like glycosyltransferase